MESSVSAQAVFNSLAATLSNAGSRRDQPYLDRFQQRATEIARSRSGRNGDESCPTGQFRIQRQRTTLYSTIAMFPRPAGSE